MAHSDLHQQLRRNIKRFRLQRKLSQRSLATASGVHFMTIRGLESGINESVLLSTIENLASALHVQVGDLLGTAAYREPAELSRPIQGLPKKQTSIASIQLEQLSDKDLLSLLTRTSKETKRRFGHKA